MILVFLYLVVIYFQLLCIVIFPPFSPVLLTFFIYFNLSYLFVFLWVSFLLIFSILFCATLSILLVHVQFECFPSILLLLYYLLAYSPPVATSMEYLWLFRPWWSYYCNLGCPASYPACLPQLWLFGPRAKLCSKPHRVTIRAIAIIAAYHRFLIWHDSRKAARKSGYTFGEVEWWRILMVECVKSWAILVIWQILTKTVNCNWHLVFNGSNGWEADIYCPLILPIY